MLAFLVAMLPILKAAEVVVVLVVVVSSSRHIIAVGIIIVIAVDHVLPPIRRLVAMCETRDLIETMGSCLEEGHPLPNNP